MYDGWICGRSHTILIFLIACPKGTMFLKPVDACDQVKDVQLLFRLLDEVVKEVGVENVVHVIKNNSFNYVAARRMLEEKHCTIW
jgi:hypothetical protein